MLGYIGFALLAVGVGWGVEFLWNFRIEGATFLYPFDAAVRHTGASVFIALGLIAEWMENRSLKQRHQHI